MATTPYALPGIALTLLAACAGCGLPGGEVGRVSGTVMIEGELAERGTITFHPARGGPAATGRVAGNGSFIVSVGQGNADKPGGATIPVGEYRVTVVVHAPSTATLGDGGPPVAGPRLTDGKYASVTTTDLSKTVVAGENVFAFDLVRATSEPEPARAETQETGTEALEAGDEPAEDVALGDAVDQPAADLIAEPATGQAASSTAASNPGDGDPPPSNEAASNAADADLEDDQ
ncbi:MAG: hypothetical protein AAGB00_09335 [Planctomycetota bacterium]